MNRKFGKIHITLFLLAMLFSLISEMVCLLVTAIFWALCVLNLRRKMAKHSPIMADLMALVLLAAGYGAVFYLIMGFGHDMAELYKGVGQDIVGVVQFPVRAQTVKTLQRMLNEILKVKNCIALAINTGNVKAAFTMTVNAEGEIVALKWSIHYLILGLVGSCITLHRVIRCILSALSEMPRWLSELRSRENG